MTPQEIFDTVYKHLVTQGEQSVNGIGFCMYRNPEGLKCAVGCLIPDDLYRPEMDIAGGGYTDVSTLVQQHPNLPDWMRKNLHLLTELQNVHDFSPSWDTPFGFSTHGHDAMRDIARHHKLDFVSLKA